MNEIDNSETRLKAAVPQSSIDALFRLEASRLTAFFARRLRSYAEAQDLTQDAFVRLARSRIDGDPLPYLRRIARNLLVSRIRRDARWRRVMEDAPFEADTQIASPPEQTWDIEAEDVKRQYQKVIDQLPEKTRRIYLMHRLEVRTYIEISRELNVSVKTVEYHIASALKSLLRGVDQK